MVGVPTAKIYHKLPPPIDEIDDVLAIIFTGPKIDVTEDFKRTPLLVRRRKVSDALEWLKLNHMDYADLEIDYESLESYPENEPPVVVDYRKSETNKTTEGASVQDTEPEDGTEDGPCPFIVHGITGDELSDKNIGQKKAIAMKHLNNQGKILLVGSNEKPESMYNNPQLYPQMY
ncbi:hypothetical protein PLICRDRAFT_103405, partial [Plicaturopsis crispa FD-325 SS-3]